MSKKEHGTEGAVVVSNVIVLLPKETIKEDQNGIKGDLNSLDDRIHKNAVQCLLHCATHRDTSLMRRLLVDVIDTKTGYRRAGLIKWMRTYSPMELSGTNINLSGVDEHGNERPFRVEEANANPFRSDERFKEVVKPLFQATLLAKINAAIREYNASLANMNEDGTPKDASKPVLQARFPDALAEFMSTVEVARSKLPEDNSARKFKLEQELRAENSNEVAEYRATGTQH